MSKEILRLENITKVYGNGIVANKNINFSVNENEIHSIVGENGAGKSTLMKIIFGMEKPSSGDYYLYDKKVDLKSANEAIDLGIGMVHQHFMLVESMNAVDNIMLGIEAKKGLFEDKEKCRKIVEKTAKQYNFKIDYDSPVSALSIGMKQKIEIMKALVRGAKILILDEPTAVLTPQETEELFKQLKVLTKSGHTILFISHKLNEVKEISDRVSVIRKGQTQGTFNIDELSLEEITSKMMGYSLEINEYKRGKKDGDVVLEVEKLCLKNEKTESLKDISFKLKSGCILGIAGVEGNGQAQLVEVLTGKALPDSGDIRYLGEKFVCGDRKYLRKKNISYIPEDRMGEGTAPASSIAENLISTSYKDEGISKKGRLKFKGISALSKKLIDEYAIVCHGEKQVVGYLSGGNMQKVVVARECDAHPKFLLAEQPSRGVDLGAKKIIHEKLIELRDEGAAIILISADLGEIKELSDEFIVMYDGEIVAHLDNSTPRTDQEIGEYMLGIKRQKESGNE